MFSKCVLGIKFVFNGDEYACDNDKIKVKCS